MVVRIIALIAVFIVLLLGAAAIYTFVFAPDQEAVVQQAPAKKVWNGRESQTYNSAWTRRCPGVGCIEELQLLNINFAGLNTKSSSMTARFILVPDPRRGRPVWLNSKNFIVRSKDNRFWSTAVTATKQADKYVVDVAINRVPSQLLVPGPGSATDNALELLIYTPSEAIAVGLQAPSPSVLGSKIASTGTGIPLPGRIPNKNDKRIEAAVAR